MALGYVVRPLSLLCSNVMLNITITIKRVSLPINFFCESEQEIFYSVFKQHRFIAIATSFANDIYLLQIYNIYMVDVKNFWFRDYSGFYLYTQ